MDEEAIGLLELLVGPTRDDPAGGPSKQHGHAGGMTEEPGLIGIGGSPPLIPSATTPPSPTLSATSARSFSLPSPTLLNTPTISSPPKGRRKAPAMTADDANLSAQDHLEELQRVIETAEGTMENVQTGLKRREARVGQAKEVLDKLDEFVSITYVDVGEPSGRKRAIECSGRELTLTPYRTRKWS